MKRMIGSDMSHDKFKMLLTRGLPALLCAFVLGAWLGATGCSSSKPQPDAQLLNQAWKTIQHNYVEPSAVQSTELTYGALSGMVDALGDTGHSTFLTPEQVKELKNMERGEFKGVGLEIRMKAGQVVIVAPIDGSPAQRAGLQAGELILKVGGEDVSDWPLTRVVQHISGKAGTKISLTVQDPRTEKTREVTLVRASIHLHDVTWEQLPATKIAHLRISTFDSGVSKDLRQALARIDQAGMRGIILDLRNNPGGLLDEAIGVASQFLDHGNVLLAKDAKGHVAPMPVEKGALATRLPMVVLVNQGSASAAEIVAGALRDGHRATLVGETTFGTGTVLGEFKLSDGSALLLAVEEWLTPDGTSFWHKGLKPQYVVTLPSELEPLLPSNEREMSWDQLQASGDKQLLKALELLGDEVPSSGAKAAVLKERN